jgi:hypothetical protein
MKTIKTEIDIEAPAETVWAILSDTDSFPKWNPFITRLDGDLRVGAHLATTIQPPGGRAMTFRPMVKSFVPGRELSWLGHLWVPGLFDGRHRFTIENIDTGKVRFRQEEDFAGILVPFMGSALRKTRHGFEAMNQALKERAESGRRDG